MAKRPITQKQADALEKRAAEKLEKELLSDPEIIAILTN